MNVQRHCTNAKTTFLCQIPCSVNRVKHLQGCCCCSYNLLHGVRQWSKQLHLVQDFYFVLSLFAEAMWSHENASFILLPHDITWSKGRNANAATWIVRHITSTFILSHHVKSANNFRVHMSVRAHTLPEGGICWEVALHKPKWLTGGCSDAGLGHTKGGTQETLVVDCALNCRPKTATLCIFSWVWVPLIQRHILLRIQPQDWTSVYLSEKLF